MRSAISDEMTRRQIHEFLMVNRAASLATVSPDGIPHVATVYCVIKPDLTIYFSTRAQGRKFNNLTENPLVAMNFTDESGMQTIQLTGMAFREENLLTEQAVLHDLITIRYEEPNWQIPPMALFEHGAANEVAIIKVVPNELTFANFESNVRGRLQPFFKKII